MREDEQRKLLAAKEADFLDLILKAYKAEKTDGLRVFHGKKVGRMVVVGPVNLPVTRLFVEEIILECRQKRITKVDLLGFEFEMGLFPNVLDEAKSKGIDIAPKYIPADVFDKRAVEKNQVVFHDVAFIEVKPLVKGKTVAVQLTDFSVFYSQGRADDVAAALKPKANKIVVEKGQIVKISKDKNGIITREKLTKEWTDWIDYWSVDFDFESKREIIRVKDEATGDVEEKWTGNDIKPLFDVNALLLYIDPRTRQLDNIIWNNPLQEGVGGIQFRRSIDANRVLLLNFFASAGAEGVLNPGGHVLITVPNRHPYSTNRPTGWNIPELAEMTGFRLNQRVEFNPAEFDTSTSEFRGSNSVNPGTISSRGGYWLYIFEKV